MSSIGYPDFFKPRDWLAGLGAQQQLFQSNVTIGGPTTMYTIPAGKTLILTRLYLQVAIVADAVGIGTFLVAVEASRGIDGGGVVSQLQRIWLSCPTSGGANDAADLAHPVQITAPAANTNLITLTGNPAVNLANHNGTLIGYGALLN